VPEFYENVERPLRVKIKALDRDGKPYELIAEGLLAVCIQHECDHLNGKLFVDYLSTLKRDRIKKKLAAPPASLMPSSKGLLRQAFFVTAFNRERP
jgi:peptide deformylase